MDFCTISKLLGESPELNKALSYEDVVMYIDLVHILKPDLSRWQPSQEDGPPERLPFATHDFLKLCLNLEEETAKLMWHTLRQVAWNVGNNEEDIQKHGYARMKYLDMFLRCGLCRGIGAWFTSCM